MIPEGITRSRAFRFNVARLPATPTRPSRGPWLATGLCCPDGSSLTTASSETLNPSPPLMDSRRRLLHPRKSAWGGDPEVPQFTPLDCAHVPPPLPRWPRRVQMTVASSSVLDVRFVSPSPAFGVVNHYPVTVGTGGRLTKRTSSLHLLGTGSAITLLVSRLQSSF